MNHFVKQPDVKPSFYERFLRLGAIEKGIEAGQLVKGRIYMSHDVEANGSHTPVGYVKVEGLP